MTFSMPANSVKSIFENVLTVLQGGDILILVPPFGNARTPAAGPYILQAVAAPLGFRTEILHVNLLLASIIGNDLFESVSFGKPFRMLGERLFSRAAHGLPKLGLSPENCNDAHKSVFGGNRGNRNPEMEAFEYKYFSRIKFDLNRIFEIEQICFDLIDEVCRAVSTMDYKIIGCSSNWEQNNCSIALINGIKKRRPDTTTLMGGSNCEDAMAEGIASLSPSIDYVFSGESERSFPEFLRQYADGKPPASRIIMAEPVNELESIPLPKYTAYFDQLDRFFENNPPKDIVIGYETSRGCWWGKCDFCGQNGRRTRFRRKTPQKAADDITTLHQRHPKQRLLLIDKLLPPDFRNTLLPLIRRKEMQIPMSCEHRPGLSLNDLINLKESGFDIIKFGIEALSTGLLQLMNKGVTAAENILLLRYARCAGVFVDWNMLWGFPLDNVDFYQKTLELIPLIRHLQPPAVLRHLSIDRFCRYFDDPEKFRIGNLRPWKVYRDVYPEWADIGRIAYRFTGDYSCGAHNHPDIIKKLSDEIDSWQKSWKRTSLTLIQMGEFFGILDARKNPPESSPHVLDADQASELMEPAEYSGTKLQKWAVKQQLATVLDSTFVPLVTAPAEQILSMKRYRTGRENTC